MDVSPFYFLINCKIVLVLFLHIPVAPWKPLSSLVCPYWSQLRKIQPKHKWNQQDWGDTVLITERTMRCFSPCDAKSSCRFYSAQWENHLNGFWKSICFLLTWHILFWKLWVKGEGDYERRKTLFHIKQIFKHGQWRNLQSTLELCPYPELPTITIADSYCALGFAVTAFTLCILSFTSLVLLFNFWKTKKNAHFIRPPGIYIWLSSISKKRWCLSLYKSLLVQVIVVTWHSTDLVGFLLGADTSEWFLPTSHVAGGIPVKLCAKERAVEKHAVGPRMEWGVIRVQEPGFPRERQRESKQKEETGLNRLPRQGPFAVRTEP